MVESVCYDILSYGILRKRSVLQDLLQRFNLEGVQVTPAFVEGYTCYYSNGINMAFAVSEKQRKKHPKAPFVLHVSVLTFFGKPESMIALYRHLDVMERGYYREVVKTTDGKEGWLYLMNPLMKRIGVENMGCVIYPDSILKSEYVKREENALIELDDEEGYIYDYDTGKRSLKDLHHALTDYIG